MTPNFVSEGFQCHQSPKNESFTLDLSGLQNLFCLNNQSKSTFIATDMGSWAFVCTTRRNDDHIYHRKHNKLLIYLAKCNLFSEFIEFIHRI